MANLGSAENARALLATETIYLDALRNCLVNEMGLTIESMKRFTFVLTDDPGNEIIVCARVSMYNMNFRLAEELQKEIEEILFRNQGQGGLGDFEDIYVIPMNATYNVFLVHTE